MCVCVCVCVCGGERERGREGEIFLHSIPSFSKFQHFQYITLQIDQLSFAPSFRCQLEKTCKIALKNILFFLTSVERGVYPWLKQRFTLSHLPPPRHLSSQERPAFTSKEVWRGHCINIPQQQLPLAEPIGCCLQHAEGRESNHTPGQSGS